MKQSIKLLLGGAFLLSLPMFLTSCEDILGEWDKPAPVNVIVTPDDNGGTTASSTYLAWDAGQSKLVDTPIPEGTPEWTFTSGDVPEGLYKVSSNFTCTELLTLKGDVKIILMDNVTMTVEQGIVYDFAGNVGELTIYAQSEGDSKGVLVINNDYPQDLGNVFTEAPAINVKTLTIHGGQIDATGDTGATPAQASHYGIEATDIIIYGGIVNATGKYGASGIEAITSLEINGGKVTAKGGDADGTLSTFGGVGVSSGTITINKGDLKATGGNNFAGSASPGVHGISGATITIKDGSLTSIGGDAADDGQNGGKGLFAGTVFNIQGGTVDVTGGKGNGTGDGGSGIDTNTIITACVKVTATGGASTGTGNQGSGFDTAGQITIPATTYKYEIDGSGTWITTGLTAIAPPANNVFVIQPNS